MKTEKFITICKHEFLSPGGLRHGDVTFNPFNIPLLGALDPVVHDVRTLVYFLQAPILDWGWERWKVGLSSTLRHAAGNRDLLHRRLFR